MALSTAALLDALFANAPIGLGSWDAGMRYERVNPALAAMNGLAPEAHRGFRPTEVLPDIGGDVEEILRRVLETGEPVRDLDVSGETPAAPGHRRHWLASFFPVRENGTAVGVTGLVLEVTAERHALQRSSFVDAELRALYEALPVGVALLSPDLRYQRVNETLARMNGRSVASHIGARLDEVLGDAADRLRAPLLQVLETGEPLEFQASFPLPHDPEDVRALEATYFPILDATGETLGVGGVVHDVTVRHQLEQEQARLLQDALVARAQAEAAQVRADSARQEAELGRERLALLALAGREMAGSMDWEETLSAVVRSAVPAVADATELTVVEPDERLRVVAYAHADPSRAPDAPDPRAADVIRTGRLEVSPDRRHAIAPLRTGAGVIGALAFAVEHPSRAFGDEDLDLVTSLAARAALHIQNARLYAERSHIADTLQRSLRPRALPEIPGIELAARYRPAGPVDGAGGDFYDVFPAAGGAWAAVIGDVSGKGPEAAAVTAVARPTLRATSLIHEEPATNLALLNRVLFDEVTADFCTAVYARLSPREGGVEVRLSNGGHPEPLLLRADGSLEAIEEGHGPLVGALEEARYEDASLTLAPGDLLLLYTDGVTELLRNDVGFGESALRELVRSLAGATAEEIVATVEAQAVELQGGRPRDDIALVAIRAAALR